MNSAGLGRAIRDAGKSFLAARLEDLYLRKNELETEESIDKLAQAYFKKQYGHHDTTIEETRARIDVALEIIREEMALDCLEILSDTKGMKPEFRKKAKDSLKRLQG